MTRKEHFMQFTYNTTYFIKPEKKAHSSHASQGY